MALVTGDLDSFVDKLSTAGCFTISEFVCTTKWQIQRKAYSAVLIS